ncbi:nonselective cation channel [Ophiostoma piceae UAMH 11346]|uniref:Nonselective cation channel n=1 Tax=Ophiostoma piceae (strain UAMH 11346) TaxID=1262450 RepID=S3D0I9_OPHP1|nr:nonselective cation channel [Ophiostoma piceae UAMH 11346]
MQPSKRPAALAPGDRPSSHQSQHHRPSFHRTKTSDSIREGVAAASGTGTGTGSPYANPPRSPRDVRPRSSRATPTPPPVGFQGYQAQHQGGRPRSTTTTSNVSLNTASGSDERTALLGTLRRTFSHELEPDPIYSCTTNPHTHLPVYTNIHRIRRDIVSVVEDYLSPEQLHDMRINLSVVRPLVDKFYELDDISIVYCLLVNRARFLHEQSHLSNRQNVNYTRATLCELIAHRILRRFNEDNEGLEGLLILSHILVAGFEPFQNAPAAVRPDADEEGSDPSASGSAWLYRKTLPALEVAILSEAKFFLSSTSCQKVIEAIYVGRVTYTPSSLLDIIPDRYKQKPIALYDPRRASLLNQYRLIVPRTRNILESCQFTILLSLYLLFMAERDASRFSSLEMAFSIYSFGWVLDQFATILEHGWHVYTQNLWSFLDVTYAVVYWAYLVLRIHGFRTGNTPGGPGQQSLDVMALAAPVLIPRIAFTLLSDNLLFVSLRSMMADFTLLTFLAAWCFAGFLLSLAWLGEGQYSVFMIGKWMVYIWFGLDGTGIQRSADFHWLFGPSLMVTFAFLGNTLFLTILVSMLSNTFSTIVSNATAEIQYRRAVLTLEGVKSDAIFAYQPPFNILALFVLVPLKFLVSPRWFHKIHVACVRSINLPILLIIAAAERRLLWPSSPYSKHYSRYRSAATDTPGSAEYAAARVRAARSSFWGKWRITAHSDIQAVFDVPPPDEVEEEIAADDDLTRHMIRRQFTRQQTSDHIPAQTKSNGHAKDKDNKDGGASRPSGATATTTTQPGLTVSDTGSGTGTLKRSGSTVKFADAAPPSQQAQDTRTPRAPPKIGASRRDSIAFPGLDPDKLRRLLQAEAEGDGSDTLDDLLGSGGAGVSHDVRVRLGALEESMQRIEGMLGQLLGSSGNNSAGLSGDTSKNNSGGNSQDGSEDENENAVDEDDESEGRNEHDGHDSDTEDIEAARAACDEVIDEDEAEVIGRAGNMWDLDQTADER